MTLGGKALMWIGGKDLMRIDGISPTNGGSKEAGLIRNLQQDRVERTTCRIQTCARPVNGTHTGQSRPHAQPWRRDDHQHLDGHIQR